MVSSDAPTAAPTDEATPEPVAAAPTIEGYLASLPADRRDAISRVREVVNANLPAGFEEGMQYGMIGWYVPLARYPETYNGQPLAVASLGSQKNHMAIYLTSVYGDPTLDKWFRDAFAAAGKRLDMGKSCVRFKQLDALPLDVIGEAIRKVSVEQFLARYDEAKGVPKQGGGSAAATAAMPSAKPAAKLHSVPATKPAPAPAAKASKPPGKPGAKATAKPLATKPTTRAKPASKSTAKPGAKAAPTSSGKGTAKAIAKLRKPQSSARGRA